MLWSSRLGHAASLWPRVEGASGYFVAQPAWVYAFVPLIVASSLILFLAPGLLLALARRSRALTG